MMKKSISSRCDSIVMSAIFLITILYLIQYILSYVDIKIHPQRLYQFFTTCEILILSGCMLWKAYRLKACIYTKIATWMYIGIILSSLIYIIIPFGYKIFLNIFLLSFFCGMITMLIAYIFKKNEP